MVKTHCSFWLSFLVTIFVLAVVWAQGTLMFTNGRYDSQGNLVFYDYVVFRDSTVHLSLIGEMLHRFPPTNFAAGGLPLKNYHYLLDAILAAVVKITGVSPLDLYFRVLPVTLSVLLSAVIYLTTRQLTKNKTAAVFAVFFTVFATSWGPVVPVIKALIGGNKVTGGSDLFLTDQLLGMMVNPQGVLSLIVFLSLFLLLGAYSRTKKSLPLIFFALLLGLSFGIKAYGGLVFAPAAFVVGVIFVWKDKDWRPLLATIAGILLMASWIVFTIDGKVAGLSFSPFWVLEKMLVDITRINEPRLYLLGQHYQAVGSWWWLAALLFFEFVIYFIGSLGLRIFGLLALKNLTGPKVFLLIAAAISFLMPFFFNQSKKAYEVIQFTPYFTLLMGILFTIVLFSFLEKIKSKALAVGVLLAVIGIFLILDKRELESRLKTNNEKIVISRAEMAAVKYISQNTPPEAIFLLPVTDFNKDYLWFSSLVQRRTVYSGERFAQQVGVNTQALVTGINESIFDYSYSDQKSGDSVVISNRGPGEEVYRQDGIVIRHYDRKE